MSLALILIAASAFGQAVGNLCLPCHSDQLDDLKKHKHFARSVSCEVCHGSSEAHRKATGAAPPDRVAASDEVPALCGGCHAAQRKGFVETKHGKLVMARSKTRAANCAVCHGVHAPRDAAAMKRQCDRCHAELLASCKGVAPKVEAGKLVCAGCHKPHS